MQTTVVGRIVSIVLSGALLMGNLGTGASIAFAEEPQNPPPPTVVSEVTGKRTETSKTYLLSDGTYRAELHADPINYETSSGILEPIDTDLVVAPDNPQAVRTAAAPVSSEFSADSPQGAPVVISTPEWTASLDMLGASEGPPLSLGDTAFYSQVQPGVDLKYQSLAAGVKETIILDGPAAPSTYRFEVALDGLEIRHTPLGSYAAYRPGSDELVLSLGSVTVWDSSSLGPANEPQFCPDVSSTVEASDGGAIITYRVDPAWLTAPERVFPVMIDPTLTNVAGKDTFVKSASPSVAYGSLDYTRCGKADASTGYNRAYVRFDTSMLASATVSAATLKLNRYAEYDGGTANRNVYVAQLSGPFDDATTWSSPATKPAQGAYFTYTTMPGTMGWVNFTVTPSIVQSWITTPTLNNGLSVYESEGGTQDKFMNWFYSRETAPGSGPRLDVTYTQSVPAATTSGSASVAPFGWFNRSDTDGDGIGDARADVGTAGRGSLVLTWSPSSGAAGYKVYAQDGSQFRQVGLVQGSASTSWASSGAGLYPSDSQVASMASGANGFARAVSPSADSRETSFVAKGETGADLGGAGMVLSDGTYLYVRRWDAYGGPSTWTKVSSGLKGTPAAGTYIGEMGPARADSRSGFYLDGFLFTGRTSTASATVLTGVWKDAEKGASGLKSLSFSRPLLNHWSGLDMSVPGSDTAVASDGRYIYSMGMSTGSYKGYDGWKVRVFDHEGQWVRDFTVAGPSYYTDGFMVDGDSAYFIEWTSSDGARITKASLVDGRMQGQWTLDQGASQLINGTYDASNDCFWLGRLDTTARIHRFAGPGLDLRDDPNALYKAIAPAGPMASSTSYAFKVAAYNAAGTAALSSCATITAQLPNRTISANADPRHTEYELGEALDDGMVAVLDEGSLALSASDLSIQSWGPGAEVSRSYSSTEAGSGRFAPGWRFSFDETMSQSGALITYTDSSGERHSFAETGGAYVAPQGFYSTLSSDTGNWLLTDTDRTVTRFDTSSGRIESVTDPNNNTLDYAWPGSYPGTLTITAANGQSIAVGMDADGKVVRARYATADGERVVSYDSASATVVRNPGVSGQEHQVTYGYAAGALSSLTVSAPGTTLGTWGFEYSDGRLAQVDYPGYPADPGLRAAISYGTLSATVTRSGEVSGTTQDITESFWWNPTGTMRKHTSPKVAAEADATWLYEYAPGNEAIIETSPAGAVIRRTVDATGNSCFEWDEEGHQTSYFYDVWSNCVRETDPRGCTTYRTFDASGNLTLEQKQLTEYERSRVEYAYNASGTLSAEERSLTATQSAVTNYGAFSRSGEAGEVTNVGVVLYPGASPTDLTTAKTFDLFGNVTSETDALGVTTARSDYSATTRDVLRVSTDATGTRSVHEFDAFGRETASFRETDTAGGYQAIDRVDKDYDAFSRVCTETYPGDAGLDRILTHAFDALGRETESDDSKVSGSAVSRYDARGNVVQSWPEGSDTSSATASTRAAFDIYGQETSRIEPGSVASATLTSYYVNGFVGCVVEPDGTRKVSVYDESDNLVREESSSDEGTVTTTQAFDIAGRQISEVDEEGNQTIHTFDLADRQVSAASAGATPSVTAYNTLGWVLAADDSDGAKTATRYDAAGRVTSETIAGATTDTSYDTLGQVLVRTNPDGTAVRFSHDAFGRVKSEVQTNSFGTVKDVETVYDALSRAVVSTDAVTSITRTWEYCESPGQDTTLTITRPGGVATTVLIDAAGIERSRTSSLTGLTAARTVTATDSAGRITAWSALGQAGSRTFDPAGRVSVQAGTGFGAAGATYAYSPTSGRKVAESVALAGPEATTTVAGYTYTATGRLSDWSASGIPTLGNRAESMVYDGVGNVTRFTKTYLPTGSKPSTVTVFDYNLSYDGSRLTSRKDGSDTTYYLYDLATGARTSEDTNTSGPKRVTYTWAPGVRLEHYRDSSRSVDATYSYNANGQRTASVVTSGSVTTTTTWTYEGLQLFALSAVPSTGAAYRIDYMYDESGRAYGGFYGSSAATMSFGVVTTDRGDVVGLSDDSGRVFAQYAYDPWGNPLVASSAATGSVTATLAARLMSLQPLRYAGYCADSESGLYYLSQRYYDPSSLQFISKDPAKADGEDSAYQYCGGNPVGGVDPSGLDVWGEASYVDSYYRRDELGQPGNYTSYRASWRWSSFGLLPRRVNVWDGGHTAWKDTYFGTGVTVLGIDTPAIGLAVEAYRLAHSGPIVETRSAIGHSYWQHYRRRVYTMWRIRHRGYERTLSVASRWRDRPELGTRKGIPGYFGATQFRIRADLGPVLGPAFKALGYAFPVRRNSWLYSTWVGPISGSHAVPAPSLLKQLNARYPY